MALVQFASYLFRDSPSTWMFSHPVAGSVSP